MKALSPIRTAALALALAVSALGLAAAHGPSAQAQSPDAAVQAVVRTAHAEALEALRTGSTASLRSFHPETVPMIAEQLLAYRTYGAVVTAASQPAFVSPIGYEANRAAVVTRTNLSVLYFGLLPDSATAEITWYLANYSGRWIVYGLSITF